MSEKGTMGELKEKNPEMYEAFKGLATQNNVKNFDSLNFKKFMEALDISEFVAAHDEKMRKFGWK